MRIARSTAIAAALLLSAIPIALAEPAAAEPPAAAATPAPVPLAQGETKHIRLDAENWRWVPDKLLVPLGTKVVLEAHSYDATHRFDLKGYGLKVVLPQDKTTTIEFVADRAGTFKWNCGRPCGDGCPRMQGTLTVSDSAAAAAAK